MPKKNGTTSRTDRVSAHVTPAFAKKLRNIAKYKNQTMTAMILTTLEACASKQWRQMKEAERMTDEELQAYIDNLPTRVMSLREAQTVRRPFRCRESPGIYRAAPLTPTPRDASKKIRLSVDQAIKETPTAWEVWDGVKWQSLMCRMTALRVLQAIKNSEATYTRHP